MSSELISALDQLEKEKHIGKETIIGAIEESLVGAASKDYGKTAITKVNMDRETGEITVWLEKTVVEEVEDPVTEVSLEEAKMKDVHYELGDIVRYEVTPKNFGRIAAQHARSIIVQKIKEEEREIIYQHFSGKEKDIVTGVVQRFNGKNISVSLDDKTDAVLLEKEQIKGEVYHPNDRIKLYIVEVKKTNRGPRILVSRTHPELVKRLFEKEVAEVFDGTVEIRSIAREAGSRTKIAVSSNDPNVDPVGACVGVNGTRVNTIVNDLHGEKIDVIEWSDDPAILIEHALSPSKVVSVWLHETEKSARVIVPDYQLSLAIGKEGQNARLAARLTGYKIDIKSETQARELEEEYEEYRDEYDEEYQDYDDDGDRYDDGDYDDRDYDEDGGDRYDDGDYDDRDYDEDGGDRYDDGDYDDRDYDEDGGDRYDEDYDDRDYDDADGDHFEEDEYDDRDYEGVDQDELEEEEYTSR